MNSTWGIRRQVNKYRLTDCVFMITGRDMAANMIEVGAFMTKRAGRGVTAMKARAALDMAWQRAARAEIPFAAAEDGPSRRRRRKKIE